MKIKDIKSLTDIYHWAEIDEVYTEDYLTAASIIADELGQVLPETTDLDELDKIEIPVVERAEGEEYNIESLKAQALDIFVRGTMTLVDKTTGDPNTYKLFADDLTGFIGEFFAYYDDNH